MAALGLGSLLAARSVLAAPAAPPGGSHAVVHVGYNRAGYPVLHMTADVPRAAPTLAAIAAPNPFRAGVTLRVVMRPDARGRVRFFTPQGRLVRSFELPADGVIRWDGRDAEGRSVPPSLYLWRADVGGRSTSGRLVRLR
jgi:hypothetical protein